MFRIFVLILLFASEAISASSAAQISPQTSSTIREQTVLIGRVGRELLYPGVLLGEGDLILVPKIQPVDSTEAPYLILLKDGEILIAESLTDNADKPKVHFDLLRAPRKIGPPASAFKFSGEIEPVPPFYSVTVPLAIQPGEPPQIHLARQWEPQPELGSSEKESTEKNKKRSLELAVTLPGFPLFDESGHLIALTDGFDTSTHAVAWKPVAEVLKGFPVGKEFLEEAPTDWTPSQLAPANPESAETLESSAAPAWLLPVSNGRGIYTEGSHAIVIDSNGLLLSKASDLGSGLFVTIRDQEYPVVLLATDDSTDLALLSVAVQGLEQVPWSKKTLQPGQIVSTPVRTTCPPLNQAKLTSTVSHLLAAHPMSPNNYWSAENITSLGIILEQVSTQPTLNRILPEGPAAKAGLQEGDLLLTLDGKELPHRAALRQVLGRHQVGEELSLFIKRDEQEIAVTISLGPARLSPPPLTVGQGLVAVNTSLQSFPSLRRSGFPDTWVHDAPLSIWQMGTPVLDQEGQALGINIATFGHGRNLVLPAATIQEAITRLKATPVQF